MDTHGTVSEEALEQEARRTSAHRYAAGKGTVLIERRNEPAEKLLSEEMTERARAGERFPSSLQQVRMHASWRTIADGLRDHVAGD